MSISEKQKITKAQVLAALPKLTDQQRDVLTSYYGLGSDLPQSGAEIGRRYNVSYQRIYAIRSNAEQKILSGGV